MLLASVLCRVLENRKSQPVTWNFYVKGVSFFFGALDTGTNYVLVDARAPTMRFARCDSMQLSRRSEPTCGQKVKKERFKGDTRIPRILAYLKTIIISSHQFASKTHYRG